MLDRFYYESSDGAYKVSIGQDGIYVCSNDIRDYEWSYTEDGSILNFKKALTKKSLPLLFAGSNLADCSKMRDKVFYIFERDVKLGNRGKIWINGYWLECFITGGANSTGIIKTRFLQTTFTVITDGIWRKETQYTFRRAAIDIQESGIDHAYDIPYDLGYSGKKTRQVIKNDCIVNSDFVLTIYGACVDPLVEIAGHRYQVNGIIDGTERLVITNVDSQKHTILKYAEDGSTSDWFGRRYKEESIFEKIPEGSIAVKWDGTFSFDLSLIETRSEPVWYVETDERYQEPEEQPEEAEPVESTDPDEPEEPDEDTSMYLTDSNNDFVIDSNGERIEVAV